MKFREKFIKIYDCGDIYKLKCLFFKRKISKVNMQINNSIELGNNFLKDNMNNICNNIDNSRYKNLLSVQGFGWSGSSAIVDLLREFDETTVCGCFDLDSGGFGKNSTELISLEVDFYRELQFWTLVDWLDELIKDELAINWAIKRLIKISKEFSNYKSIFKVDFQQLFNNFILSISDLNVEYLSIDKPLPLMWSDIYEYNINYNKYTDKVDVFYKLRNITKEQYINYCKIFNQSILKSFYSKKFLVLDQFLGCYNGYDLDFHSNFLGTSLKQICVCRDPRDQFYTLLHASGLDYTSDAFLKSRKIDKVCRSVEDFKDFLLNVTNIKKYQEYHPNRLMIRFEDLINDYENSITKVCDFLGIDKSHHINKGKYFIPEVSRKNIGIYKNYHDQRVMDKIKEELGEYCYE